MEEPMSNGPSKASLKKSGTKRLIGVLADDAPKGFLRLSRPDDVDDFLEIKEDDVRSREVLKNKDGSERVALFIDRDADIRRCSTIRISREAELLQGSLLAQFVDANRSGAADRGRDILVQLYVAKTETTLTCWEDCTFHISNCLAIE
jgi:hypothetical protein